MKKLEKLEVKFLGLTKGDFTPEHKKASVLLSNGIFLKKFSYQYNPKYTKFNKKDFLFAIFSDALSYLHNKNIDDFQKEFGYDKASECLKAFESCKETYQFLNNQFKFTNENILEIYDYLQK